MKINIVCVGNIKEKFYKEACAEYLKRLKRFCSVTLKETPENTVVNNPNQKQIIDLLNKEAENYIKYLKGYVVVMDISGKEISSEEFSKTISQKKSDGISEITFLIGGSYGICDKIKEKADYRLSFSSLTFPHRLFRVMLLEQLYRAFMIEGNMTYHK